MGASSWTYFVPFQPDIAKALRELQERVFEEGAYFKPEVFYGAMMEGMPDMPADLRDALRAAIGGMEAPAEPQTIEELVEISGESGTHSVLDMQGISPSPGFGRLAPLETRVLVDLFGTDKPTHSMIAEKTREILGCCETWEGTYIVVYEGDSPHEIFFAGLSGD